MSDDLVARWKSHFPMSPPKPGLDGSTWYSYAHSLAMVGDALLAEVERLRAVVARYEGMASNPKCVVAMIVTDPCAAHLLDDCGDDAHECLSCATLQLAAALAEARKE